MADLQLQDTESTREMTDAELGVPSPSDAVYTIRPLTKAVFREKTRKHTAAFADRRSGQKETKWDAVTDDLLDYALVSWKNIRYKGELVPCTRENKALLDAVRSQALLDAAGMGEVQEASERRKESFREPASVV